MSLSSRSIRSALIPALLLVLGTVLGAQEDSTDYDRLVVEMLEGYQELLSIPMDDDVEDLPGFSWHVVGEAISRGYLRFTVDPVHDSVLNGARFIATPGQETAYVMIDTALLDAWETHPSLAYSVLTRAVRSAAVFFQNPPAWGAAQTHLIERLFYDSDEYKAMALLIRDRLIPGAYLITPFESFVLDSFEKDDLASAMLYLKSHSLPVARELFRAQLAFEEGGGAGALRDAIIGLGEDILESRDRVPAGSSDSDVFPMAIAVHSWLEFSPEPVSRIHNKDRRDDPMPFDEVLEEESEYAEMRRRLEARRTRDMPLMEHVLRETERNFSFR